MRVVYEIISGFFVKSIDQVFGLIVLVLSKKISLSLCVIWLILVIYIYEHVNLVFVTLCDVANISNI